MRIVIQIGYSKSMGRRREGQKVSAFVNDVECTWGGEGQYLTSYADTRKGYLWYMWEGDLEDGDVITLKCSTMIINAGPDENRTYEKVYVVDSNSDILEVFEPQVGLKGYPLLKGRVIAVGSVSEADKREADIAAFLDDESF